MDRSIISVLVDNHSGVLSRVSGLFSRRGYNIDSLTVGPTINPDMSRITITVTGDSSVVEQIVKQLNKLVEVIHVEVLANSAAVYRELALVKIKANGGNRAEIIEITDIFRSKIIDVSPTALTVEITGDQDKISAFLELIEPHGILEIARTGLTGLERGASTIHDCIVK